MIEKDYGIPLMDIENSSKKSLMESFNKEYYKGDIIMIITLKKDAPQKEVDALINQFESAGLQVNIIHGDNFNVFGLVGDTAKLDDRRIKT